MSSRYYLRKFSRCIHQYNRQNNSGYYVPIQAYVDAKIDSSIGEIKSLIGDMSKKMDINNEKMNIRMDNFESAIKTDMNNFQKEIKIDMNNFQKEIKIDMNNFQKEIKTDMNNFKSEIKTDMTFFKTSIGPMMISKALAAGIFAIGVASVTILSNMGINITYPKIDINKREK